MAEELRALAASEDSSSVPSTPTAAAPSNCRPREPRLGSGTHGVHTHTQASKDSDINNLKQLKSYVGLKV